MALLRLVRHGQTSWNEQGLIQGHIDVPLNETGREQAHAAARRLQGVQYSAVISSPLSRALETATIIAGSLGAAPVEINPAIIEQTLGSADGRRWSELDGLLESGSIVGAETHVMLQKRAISALNLIGERFQNETVIVVSHGALIDAVNRYASFSSGAARRPAANGSISDIHVRDGDVRVDS